MSSQKVKSSDHSTYQNSTSSSKVSKLLQTSELQRKNTDITVQTSGLQRENTDKTVQTSGLQRENTDKTVDHGTSHRSDSVSENSTFHKGKAGSSKQSVSSSKVNILKSTFQMDRTIHPGSSQNSMSSSKSNIFFSEFHREVLSPIVSWRRTEHKDVEEITKLIKVPQTLDLFGDFDVATIIEHSYISVSQLNAVGDIVAYIALYDYPNIPAVPPSTWLHWLTTLYKLNHATVRNTLFIHLLVWNPKYSHEFLPLLLDYIFINNPYLQNIILVVPPGSPTSPIFNEVFAKTLPPKFTECNKVQTLHICTRHLHIQRLKIRRAVEEDNDDIVPILDKLASKMRVMYGDYYIAEMIQYPSKKKEIIVAEENEVAIGVTIMSIDINFDLLNEQFELAPFYGLRKEDERDRIFVPELQRADSREGLRLPVFLRSDDSLSLLSCLSVLFEVPADASELETSSPSDDSESDIILSFVESATSSLFLSRYYDHSSARTSTPAAKFSGNPVSQWSSQDREVSGKKTMHRMSSLEDMNYSPASSMTLNKLIYDKVQTQKIPSYYGLANAFSLEVFAMNENYDERLTFDFLEAAFEVFPELDYCIITVPSENPCFSLLEHFTRVTPRINRSFPNELYVVHRNAVISDLQVRLATQSDQESVEELLSHVERKEKIKVDFLTAVCYEDSYKAYIMLSEGTVVGLAIVSPEEEVEYLRSHYTVENFIDFDKHKAGCHGLLKQLALSPIFQRHTRFFLKEVHRLSYFTVLFYPLYYNESIELQPGNRSLISSLAEMLPVLPRRQIEYNIQSLDINRPSDEVLRKELPFALYMMTPRYASMPKIEINTKIVVVGASDTGLAFLEALIFGPSSAYLTYNNITLVSPHGLPGDNDLHHVRDKMIPYRGRYNAQYMARINIRSYVNLVYGLMTSINRTNTYIGINDESSLHYEYLMLFCGVQFKKPVKYEEPSEQFSINKCMHDQRKMPEDDATFPHNVFLVNTEIDALNALVVLQRLTAHQSVYQIVVYGYCIHAYCCIDALIDFGIPSRNIVFVECLPRDTHLLSYFNNKELDDEVQDSLLALGVRVLSRYYFTGWEMDEKHNRIIRANFESKTKPISLDCLAMFCYGNKDVSTKTFKALNSAGLVYDGRLVISAKFETNDPRIFAAGSLTKYKRIYYADHLRHGYFNSVEIGTKMGEMFSQTFDPTTRKAEEKNHKANEENGQWFPDILTPDYTQPLIVSATLPGGVNYLNVCKPGMVKPLEAAMNHMNYGLVLITGDNEHVSSKGYFRLHLNHRSLVETITCYTIKPIQIDNLTSLYGKHEQMLNNLVVRFNLGRIRNFFEYFQEPWTCGIFHDRFEEPLCQARLQLLSDKPIADADKSLIEDILAEFIVTNWEKLNDSDRELVGIKYELAGYDRLLEKIVIDFIDRNNYHLPMYATPAVIRRLLDGINNSQVDTSPVHYVQ